MRGYLNTLLQVTTIGLVVLVLGNIGFGEIWDAAKDIFPSWGSFFTFVLVMAGLSGLVFAWSKNH
ncbi:hypothetical protein [Actinomadura citrea]|uniref:Uncharacterized protein n=1 Tax=Actinomadura citrea TaxID=46158 RepID=A0A7Y9GAT0_9ACTN|nr:hypothetical protein [Actinomadura citrea]NYE13114.1 hypothetical protein [Actinomadura citrea]GGT88323.1 hypothetical protein GCM10010177_54450 [Actinomadura citrea]